MDITRSLIIWLQSIFHSLSPYLQRINRFFSGAFGAIAALLDLYRMYDAMRDPHHAQRKTAIATHLSNFALNAFYTVGVIFLVVSFAILNIVALGVDLISLIKMSYMTHQARRAVNATKAALAAAGEKDKDNLLQRLNKQREYRFKCKVDTAYTVLSAISTATFIGGCFFPPLLLPALIAFTLFKVVQFADYYTDLKFSRWLSGNHRIVEDADPKELLKKPPPAPRSQAAARVAMDVIPPRSPAPVPAVEYAAGGQGHDPQIFGDDTSKIAPADKGKKSSLYSGCCFSIVGWIQRAFRIVIHLMRER